MIKLVAVDLDGTFLNSKRHVSLENKEMIDKIQNMGIRFVTNSGRTYEGVRHVLDDTNIQCESICMNGASVYNKEGKLIKACYMKKEDVMDIISYVDMKEFFVEFNTNAGTCIAIKKEEAESFLRGWISLYNSGDISAIEEEEIYQDIMRLRKSFIYISNVSEIFDRGYQVFKIAISHKDTNKISELREKLSLNSNLSVSASFHTNIEITDKRADKGIALEQYAKEHGIKMEEVMCFGDSLNDYSMLKREFGYTVAMENAIEPIKEVAKFHTLTNDESGVAKFIQKIVFDE
ncbi:MAG: HAD family phosphatase [Candidatus Galacturonibacter soehngenii]|nr:HAD family phosphatase [Candidatus Galacturonibacter soehngenii]